MVRRLLLVLFLASAAHANELAVDKKTMQLDDTVDITLALEGSFATLDPPKLETQNLVIDGSPSVSAEFQWINGVTSRRRVFHYNAHPRNAGVARVGPVTLRDANGVQLTLPAVTLTVVPDVASGSQDPIRIIHELIATGRDPIFVLGRADRNQVFEGEEIVVTWTLYAAATINQYSLGDIPKLEDFWTEELEVRNDQPEQVMLGDVLAQRLTVRRAAVFPLRSGTLTIGAMTVHASMMKRLNRGDPFGLFEGVMSDVHRRSPPIVIESRAIPPGPPVVAVTNVVNLLCGGPSQKSGGPAFFDVTMSARGNLRAAHPPAFESAVDGTLQIVNRGTTMVYPVSWDLWMTRRWRYLIFPSQTGTLRIPALSVRYLTPDGERRESRCEAKTLDVAAASASSGTAPSPVRQLQSRRLVEPALGVIAVIGIALVMIPRLLRQRRLRRSVQSLTRDTPAATRDAVEAELVRRGTEPSQLIKEASDRGDAFRAFRSLIDAAEHDRIAATPRDIAHRIRDLLVALESSNDRHTAPQAARIHDR